MHTSRLAARFALAAALLFSLPVALPSVAAAEPIEGAEVALQPTHLIEAVVVDFQLRSLKTPSDMDCTTRSFWSGSEQARVQNWEIVCVPIKVQPTKFCLMTTVSAGNGGSAAGFGGAISSCVPVPLASCGWVTPGTNKCSAFDIAIGYPPLTCRGYATTPSYWWGCGATYVGI